MPVTMNSGPVGAFFANGFSPTARRPAVWRPRDARSPRRSFCQKAFSSMTPSRSCLAEKYTEAGVRVESEKMLEKERSEG